MEITLVALNDSITRHLRNRVIPLAIESLKDTNHIDYALRESVISKLRGRGYKSSDENVVMSISLDPKTCGIPIGNCSGDCNGCFHNPLMGLLEPYDGPVVLTSRGTITLLLDVISLLANANKNALLREKRFIDKADESLIIYDDDSLM